MKRTTLSLLIISLMSASIAHAQQASTEKKAHSHSANEAHERDDGHGHTALPTKVIKTPTHQENDGHTHPEVKATLEEAHEEGVTFTPEQMKLANIKVAALVPKIYQRFVYAPGEIKANGYTSYILSARTESVVVKRHVMLGQHIHAGEPLVTLFSESVAQAQATYRVAYTEWQRAKKLEKGTVSESRLLTAQTDYIAAFSRLKAYGLTKQAIDNVIKNNASNLGEYTLYAQTDGAVINDDFSQGQRVAAGDSIMKIAQEDKLWVEARVSPNKQIILPKGTKAMLSLGTERFEATVIQEAHTIDPITRTRTIRLEVDNLSDRLHPGMFVDVNFLFDTPTPVMAVPEGALTRGPDGDWMVYVEDHPGEFEAVEVDVVRSLGDYRQIQGINPNSRVVIEGAFFVASQIAKGGFDPHNH
ncbi:MAG: efflux RND transporter periplasmic adaptor subunit [Psychrobium sp.]